MESSIKVRSISRVNVITKWASIYGVVNLFVLVLKVFRSWLGRRRMHRVTSSTPQAKYAEHWLLGDLPDLLANLHRMHDYRAETVAGLPVCWVAGPKWDSAAFGTIITDPACLKHVLKDNFDNYTKPLPSRDIFWHGLQAWLGDGIFMTRHGTGAADKGRNWMKQRKIAASIFTRSNFNANMNEVFVAKGKRLCDLLATPAATGTEVDMQAMFFNYTMDSIMKIFFGQHSDTLGGDENKYASAYDTAHRGIIKHTFSFIGILSFAQFLPWPFGSLDGLAHSLCKIGSPDWQKFEAAYRTLDSESSRLVSLCRLDPLLPERRDLLALFVQAEDKEQFSTTWLRDLVLNFVIAGRDTTACTLSWMFYILASHPEIQDQLILEVDEKFAAGVEPTFKSVSHSEMPYLNGVLYETFRLYPPVPVDPKEATADDTLPNGMSVPKNSKVLYSPYCMGRDPHRYPDPDVVRPQRWIPFSEPSPYEFPVFQAGPRICLGMSMAIFEAKCAAIMLLRDYSFTLLAGEAEKICYLPTALTMSICNSKAHDSHNLWLLPKQRQHK